MLALLLVCLLGALVAFAFALPHAAPPTTRALDSGTSDEAAVDLGATELGGPLPDAAGPVTVGPVGGPVAPPARLTPVAPASEPAAPGGSQVGPGQQPVAAAPPVTLGPPIGGPLPTVGTKPVTTVHIAPTSTSTTRAPATTSTTTAPVSTTLAPPPPTTYALGASSGGTANPASTGWSYRRGDGGADPAAWPQLEIFDARTSTWSCDACARPTPTLTLDQAADGAVARPGSASVGLVWHSPAGGRVVVRGALRGTGEDRCTATWTLRVAAGVVAQGTVGGDRVVIGGDGGVTAQLATGDPVALVLVADGGAGCTRITTTLSVQTG